MTMYQQQPHPPRMPQRVPEGISPQYLPSGMEPPGTRGGRFYRLSVEQQPVRARMCGFGDKDRRPITPPPCIRLIVCDAKTGQEVDFNEIDSTYFVLLVDLWDEESTRAVNLVRHSSAAPTVSISSSTVTAFPPPQERVAAYLTPGMSSYDQHYRQPMVPQPLNPYGHHHVPQGYATTTGGYAQYGTAYGQNPAQTMTAPMTSNHTRNLIGMNAVNACRLNDLENKTGFWFVLQDLSVRTEGTFRLKLSLFDIGSSDGSNAVVEKDGPTQGKGPILACNFSEAFTVYSAKKFPGVIESTPLSKCFAQQGIKIPIRKDGPKISNQAEYDADD